MMKDIPYLAPFREELLASGLVLLLVVTASFFTVSRLIDPEIKSEEPVRDQNPATAGQILGEKAPTLAPSLTSVPAGAVDRPSPTADPLQTEVAYGQGGSYEYPEYLIEFSQPRLQFDLQSPAKRKFVIDVILVNRSVEAGLDTRVAASIMKDGNVIVPKAVLSSPEKLLLMPGETMETVATLSLIEGTDVKEILFTPQTELPQISHPLRRERNTGAG